MSINLTVYARALGYAGARDVLVSNGLVVSHRNQDWLSFCEKLREQIPAPDQDLKVLDSNPNEAAA